MTLHTWLLVTVTKQMKNTQSAVHVSPSNLGIFEDNNTSTLSHFLILYWGKFIMLIISLLMYTTSSEVFFVLVPTQTYIS